MKNPPKIIAGFTAMAFMFLVVTSFAGKKSKVLKKSYHNGITYVVTVTPNYTGAICGSYRVVVMNGEGNACCAPLEYQEGINYYIFHESGPVTGSRVACLEKISSAGNYQCGQEMNSQPDEITGDFRDGFTYLFNVPVEMTPGLD